MRTCSKPSPTIDWFEPDESRSIRTCQAWPRSHDASDEIFLFGHHPLKTEVTNCGLSVQFVAGHVTFFDSHHAEGLSTVKANAVTFAGKHDRANCGVTVCGIDRHFVGKFA